MYLMYCMASYLCQTFPLCVTRPLGAGPGNKIRHVYVPYMVMSAYTLAWAHTWYSPNGIHIF